MFRKLMYNLMDWSNGKTNKHYEIHFPESLKDNEHARSNILKQFDKEVQDIAWRLGIKIEEKDI